MAEGFLGGKSSRGKNVISHTCGRSYQSEGSLSRSLSRLGGGALAGSEGGGFYEGEEIPCPKSKAQSATAQERLARGGGHGEL